MSFELLKGLTELVALVCFLYNDTSTGFGKDGFLDVKGVRGLQRLLTVSDHHRRSSSRRKRSGILRYSFLNACAAIAKSMF